MKKVLIAAAATVLLASCKKDKTTTTADNSWTLGATSYSGSTTLSGTSLMGAYLNANVTSAAYFTVDFAVLPTASGTYNIVEDAVDSNEVSVNVSTIASPTSAGVYYTSTGNDYKTATVTVTNGKIKVSIPTVSVRNDDVITDSTMASGVLVQP